MNTLIIKKDPDTLTKSKFLFNGHYYGHVHWAIRENILTFEGYRIELRSQLWSGDRILRTGLDKIEDRFIKSFTEGYGFLHLKKRKFRGVTGEYVLKERNYRKLKTNVWTVIDQTGEKDYGKRTTNQE